ncbi:unnamed protein product [Allacma fusca]|uniref:Uncharacterized protein n=1 Tax=Allacma fusca TaxID=39272 RepID=A0A8J2K631_9HEXA|nr:unnamed protein product [Allacma fusca]
MIRFPKLFLWFLLFQCLLPTVHLLEGIWGLPHIQLEQHHVNIDLERNRFTDFKFVQIQTQISKTWKDLTEPPTNPSPDDCKTSLDIDLSSFEFPTITAHTVYTKKQKE